MNEVYTLNTPLIDFLTITSFEERAHGMAKAIITALQGDDKGATLAENAKRMQYLGVTLRTAQGTLFYGEGKQKGRWHCMFQIDGELCNEPDLLNPIFSAVRQGWVSVRRIDLQATIIEPTGWIQWALFNRLKLRHLTPGWQESMDKKGNTLATVYALPRTSEKFLRVYQKFAGMMLLRMEWEIKAAMAESIGRAIADGRGTVSQYLKLYWQNLNDPELTKAYSFCFEGIQDASKPKRVVRDSKTSEWLRVTVLPSFTRYINEHGHDQELVNMFIDALRQAEYWQDE
mgnify:CR=1 FL=1